VYGISTPHVERRLYGLQDYWATFHSPRLALGAYLLHLGHDIKKEYIDLAALLGCILRSIRTAASR